MARIHGADGREIDRLRGCILEPELSNMDLLTLAVIRTTIERDQTGREHLRMNFHVCNAVISPCHHMQGIDRSIEQVEGPLNSGVVFVHMIKPADKYEWEYRLLALDVKGGRIALH